MMDFPTGTVTFLFTDIEGSTKLLQTLGDVYSSVLTRHQSLLREAFEKWNGKEVDTQGDSFFVAFPRASDAINAAVDGQRALRAQAWPQNKQLRVRMGLHTGEPIVTDGGYVGVDVHRAARISAAGYGGQILLSSSTENLLSGDSPQGTRIVNLGEHRLRDLSHPEQIYQLRMHDLPSDFPPLRTLDTHRTNLPFQHTSFIGRERELHEISDLMAKPECRLLTLLGPGGIGKSRLALQSAAAQVPSYVDGTYFIPLAPVRSADYIVSTVAGALQLTIDTHSSDVDSKGQLLDYLGGRSLLMVMDNFEHVLEGANLLADIIEMAPNIKFLVTSRERLNLQGEWTFDVEGMSLPENGSGAGIEKYSALVLFHERALQVKPDFELSKEVYPHIRRICKLAGGMPLGIELAAAWVSMLSCQEIADEIEKNIDFLSSSRKDLPEKHRSLRAAFDYSWNLLAEDQQNAFRNLSVFRGSFTREAASQVAGAQLNLLSDLANKSLLFRNPRGHYEIHELLRQYAEEKLGENPEERNEILNRHSRYFIEFLAAREQEMMGEKLIELRAEVREEIDNLRAGIHWAVLRWDQEQAREALAHLNTFYLVHGWHEGSNFFSAIAETIRKKRNMDGRTEAKNDPVYLSAWMYEAAYLTHLGVHEKSEEILRELLPQVQELKLQLETASTISSLGINSTLRGEYANSIALFDEAIPLAKAIDEHVLVGIDLLWQGWDYYLLGDYEPAQACFEESLQIYHRRKNNWGLAFALSKLGLLAEARKDYAKAEEYHEKGKAIFIELGDKAGEAYTLSRLSMTSYSLEDYERASELGRQGLEMFKEVGHRWGIGVALCRIGFAAIALGNTEKAGGLFYEALERALDHKLDSLALYALGGIATLLGLEGEDEKAFEIFSFTFEHPALPQIYDDLLKPIAEKLKAKLSDEQIHTLNEKADQLELQELGERMLRENVVVAL